MSRNSLVASVGVAKARRGKTPERSRDVTLRDFLAHGPSLPHLFEATPDLDPAAFSPDGDPTTLIGKIRARGGRTTDVRLLVADGEKYVPLAKALAERLRCDVYLTPNGTDLRYVHETNPGVGQSWAAIAFRRDNREP